jgi:hypothetical protein
MQKVLAKAGFDESNYILQLKQEAIQILQLKQEAIQILQLKQEAIQSSS